MNKYGIFVVIGPKNLILTYSIPQIFSNILPFHFFKVPLKTGIKKETIRIGILIQYCERPEYTCKEVISPYLEDISLTKSQLNLAAFIDNYYLSRPQHSLPILIPGFFWNLKNHSLIEKELKKIKELENAHEKNENLNFKKDILLSHPQQQSMDFILQNQITLLHGITGSGKTEIYMKCAIETIKAGKNVLILIPEIALTPQLGKRFENVFKDNLSLIHSKLSKKKYVENWAKIYFQKVNIVIGVRSAVFCPLKNIGLIIVDEEHDNSYKNQKFPYFHSRDLCVFRAHHDNAKCILGSGTPSLESYYNSQINKYSYFFLSQKYSNQKISYEIFSTHPNNFGSSQIIKKSSQISSTHFYIAPEILTHMKEIFEKKEQMIILYNRRGFFNYAVCSTCHQALTCTECSVTTTLHEFGKTEICHYCEKKMPARKECPHCLQKLFYWKGSGTQYLESELKKEFPNNHFARFDKDTTSTYEKLNQILDNFENHKIDALVGTQMLSKGHDFSNVTLVVAFYLEDILFLPDFRSSERVFQLIQQTMGRTSRGKKPGKFLLQSLFQESKVTLNALENDFTEFYEREIKRRKTFHLPPLTRQILIEVKHKKKETGMQIIQDIEKCIVMHAQKNKIDIHQFQICGPVDALIEKVKMIFRVQITLQFSKNIKPKEIFPENEIFNKKYHHYVSYDVDPFSFF